MVILLVPCSGWQAQEDCTSVLCQDYMEMSAFSTGLISPKSDAMAGGFLNSE